MGKTEPIKMKPRKSVNLPPKKSDTKKVPKVKRVYARSKQAASQSIEAGKNQRTSQSTSDSSESSNGEIDRKEGGVSDRSKQIKKKNARRSDLLSRIRSYYDVTLNSTVALSTLGQKDIAFLFEKSDRTLEDDLDFCESKLNELNECGTTKTVPAAARASDSGLSSSSDGSSFELKGHFSPETSRSADGATHLEDSEGYLLMSYALPIDEETDTQKRT